MKLLIILIFIIPLQSHALQCLELFTISPKLLSEMTIVEIKEGIEERMSHIAREISEMRQPTWRERLLTSDGADQYRERQALMREYHRLGKVNHLYKIMVSLIGQPGTSHSFTFADERALIFRVAAQPALEARLQLIFNRQNELGDQKINQTIINALLLYLAWGPPVEAYRMPLSSWVFFDLSLLLNDQQQSVIVEQTLRNTAMEYKILKYRDEIFFHHMILPNDPVLHMMDQAF